MAGIEANIIQEMVDQIEAFKRIIEKAGEEGRNKLKSIKLDEVFNEVPRTAGKVDPTNWSNLGEDKQKELHDRLTLVRDALHSAAELDGPTDPKHIMYAEYASNTTIIIWTLLGFLLTAFLLGAVVSRWNAATGTDFSKNIQVTKEVRDKLAALEKALDNTKKKSADVKAQLASKKDEKTRQEAEKAAEKLEQEVAAGQAEVAAQQTEVEKKIIEAIKAMKDKEGGTSEGSVLTMVILCGALGGSLHLVSSLVMFIGNRQLKRSWLTYYLAMPFTGAGLAPVVYMLLRVGLLNPAGTASSGTSLSGLNFIAIYAFAAMTGMFSRNALDKLGEVFNTIFKTQAPPSKDTLGPKKPASSSPPDAVKSP